MHTPKIIERIRKWFVIAGFLGIIFLPLLDNIFAIDPVSGAAENRKLTEFPNLSWDTIREFPDQFNRYFGDHHGFRNALIQGRSLLLMDGLGLSPSDKVLLGKDGWLFYIGSGKLDYYRGSKLFTVNELDQWRIILEKNRNLLAKLGSHYLVVIAPNKDSIYPEYMPDRISKLSKSSRLDQLVDYMNKHSDVEILDLRKPLINAKKHYSNLYSYTDTHWNGMGSYVAYKEITNILRKWFPQLSTENTRRVKFSKKPKTTDLVLMTGIQNIEKEEVISVLKKSLRPAQIADSNIPVTPTEMVIGRRPHATEIKNASLPTAVLLHDSFGALLKPLLSQDFARIAYFHYYYYSEHIKMYESPMAIFHREKPDVVIHEFVERNLQAGVNITDFSSFLSPLVFDLIDEGRKYSDQKEHKKAIALLKKAVDLDSGKYNAWANLGLSYKRDKQYKSAIISLRKSITINPKQYYPYYLLAEIFYAEGDLISGKEWAKKAMKFASNETNRNRARGLIIDHMR